MSTRTTYSISMPHGNKVAASMFQLRRALIVATTALVSVAAQNASAYDFQVQGGDIGDFESGNQRQMTFVHITTVSSLCHDRTALDVNRGDQPSSIARGSTASICLVNGVQAVADGRLYTWSGVGMPGGLWVLDVRTPNSSSIYRDGGVPPQ